mmetsp:Transcript_89887/g.159931  ORF Transcript_89887/g.159931 Transcript_89887/m.159931 type:complete len:815 (-) Transcript_89887:109-2553(-)|eukprot:CAMPEP_0197636078 /NCGR_PEP_ID=MMETSP1338-20131121/11697_1 /TAXON_ID=43686 ORGANISM="Pelagodinium beii, Strain RCC1491" /NCGR_SAMPLE_ID=MMETSP1338 /ASSEMBLY_ACC=CAM_ASM_000754 /LENGTH=814 /DNA_ID=CAMNT_0043208249 /DNA_START=38 /DNA_END=2482 /DNA_ORIENTATION=-
MAALPQVVGGAGAALLGTAIGIYQKDYSVPLCLVTGAAGAALLILGFQKTSVPRGRPGCNLNEQSVAWKGSGEWKTEKDEAGAQIQVYHAPKRSLAFPFEVPGDKDEAVKDKNGLVKSYSPQVNTTYDMIMGCTKFDSRPAVGRCVRQHTFKDAVLPDGKPNPKPQVVDVPASWDLLTYAELKKEARGFGTCLRKKYGLAPKEKISIWATNSVEWLCTDLACAAYNWVSVSVYDSLGPDAASYIVADSGSKVLVCEDKTFKKVPALLDDAIYKENKGAALEVVVYMGKGDAATKAAIEAKGLKVVGFHEAVKECSASPVPDTPPVQDDIITIMYTSGTTGMPKGVMLTHQNVVCTVSLMVFMSPAVQCDSSDVHLSYLPLAHIFERQNVSGLLACGALVYFASNGAKALLADLGVIRPTIFAGVPKVYENVRDAVVRKMTGFKSKLFKAAMAAKVADMETGCGYSKMWDTLVFAKTKKALGGRVRFCVTGGAPISKDTLHFVVAALGPVVQGYGATETSAASTLTMSFDLTLGHVGPPVGTVAIRLVDVGDMNYYNGPEKDYSDAKAKAAFSQGKAKCGGEVWIGGPSVSPGYYDPSVNGTKAGVPSNGMSKKTSEEFFKEDGWSWFKTGDIGTWAKEGTLKIVDRKKNMFKTSLGEYVPVEEVEKTYQDNCGFADFVFLPKETKVAYVGLVVVVSDSIRGVMKWAEETGVKGSEAEVVASDKFRQYLFDTFITIAKEKKLQPFLKVQKPHNIFAQYQVPGYQEEWVNGVKCPNGHTEQLLTATFKARRTQLDQYYAKAFQQMYPDRPADHILP